MKQVAPVRVLVVDDSAIVRAALTKELSAHPEIEVVGAAQDPFVARDMIQRLNPSVIVLDLEMPRMDGLSFLRRLMAMHPLPVIICSSLSQSGSEVALACLDAGAFEVFSKPNAAYSIGDLGRELTRAVLAARHVKPKARVPAPSQSATRPPALTCTTNKVIAIGSSTGGPPALQAVFEALPGNMPGMVVVQHMPPGFTASLAKRLEQCSQLQVREARDGDLVSPGKVLLAPGGFHLQVVRTGAQYVVAVKSGPPVRHHKPSVEVLFGSVADNVGANAMGVVLTGMGNDGASALKSMHTAGAFTVAQDEATSVVWGMPREAIQMGGVDEVLPLPAIAQRMVDFAQGSAKRRATA